MAPHAGWKLFVRVAILCSVAIIGVAGAWLLYGESTGSLRRFMAMEIERTGNSDDVWLFMSYLPSEPTPATYDDVPFTALLPAFMLSELKTAIQIVFQISLSLVVLLTVAWLLTKLHEYTRRRIAHNPGCL